VIHPRKIDPNIIGSINNGQIAQFGTCLFNILEHPSGIACYYRRAGKRV
jgi:hypothetical protein